MSEKFEKFNEEMIRGREERKERGKSARFSELSGAETANEVPKDAAAAAPVEDAASK